MGAQDRVGVVVGAVDESIEIGSIHRNRFHGLLTETTWATFSHGRKRT
jgi:hypothetical protein